jgi:DNA-binding response OmpR family regulator
MTKILIVDRDTTTLTFFNQLKLTPSLEFHQVNSGVDGLKWAEEEQPGLILLSVELTDMNGFLACKKFRESAKVKRIPIIIISSEVGPQGFKQHKKLKTRADVYLQKPLNSSKVIEFMAQLMAIEITVADLEDDLDLDNLLVEDTDLLDMDLDIDEPSGNSETDELKKLRTQLDDQAHQLDYYKKELDASKTYFNQMQGHKGGNDIDLKQKDQQIERLQFDLKALEDDQKKKQNQILELEQTRAAMQSSQKDLEEKSARLQEQLDAEHVKFEELETKVQFLNQQIEEMGEQGKGVEQEQQDLLSHSQTLEKNLYQTQEIVDDLSSKLDEKENVTKNRELAFQDEIRELENALDTARQTNQQVEESLMDREAEVLELQESIKELKAQINDKNSQSGEIEKEIHRLQREHTETMNRLTDDYKMQLETLKENYEKDLLTRESEIQRNLNHTREDLEDKLAVAIKEFETCKINLNEAENLSAEKEEAHRQEMLSIQKKNQKEIDSLEEELQSGKQELSELKSKLDETGREIQNLVADITEKNKTIDDLKKQNDLLKVNESAAKHRHEEKVQELQKTHTGQLEELEVKLKQAYTLQEELCEQRDLLKKELLEKDDLLQSRQSEWGEFEKKLHMDLEGLEKRNAKIISDQESQIETLRRENAELQGHKSLAEGRESEIHKLRIRVDQLNLGHQTVKKRLQLAEEILEEGLKNLKGETETLDFEE